MSRCSRLAAAMLALGLLAAPPSSRAADPIVIAHAESVGSLPIRIATQRGWWARVELAPRFKVFPSELPLMSAAGAGGGAWDLAVVGVGIAVLGAARYDTTVIGLTADRSGEVALFAGGLGPEPAPERLQGLPAFANRATTAALTAHACLEHLAIAPAPPGLRDRQPGDVARALEVGETLLGAVPSPFIESVRRAGRAAQLCSARDAGLVATDDIVVRHRFLEQRPDVAARAMATILRALAWLQANPGEARTLLAGDDPGAELRARIAAVTFDLARTASAFEATPQGSEIERWHERVAAIQRRTGDVREAPYARSYVDASVLARIAGDARLRAFATLGDRTD